MLGTVVSFPALLASTRSIADSAPLRPDPKDFQAGDLIWPKKPGDWVAYNSVAYDQESAAETQWNKEKKAFIGALRARWESATPQEKEAVERLSSMSYRDFKSIYLGDTELGAVRLRGGSSGFYVGHVAIVTQTSQNPLIVEAIQGEINKVRTMSYADWLADRQGQNVWLGRLDIADPAERAKVPAEALKYVGQKYDFWNFDLNDDSGFYCSKLVWLSVFRSLGIAVDNKKDPKRSLWFSPKQLMNSHKHIALRFDPCSYGSAGC